jgi:membrane associated rhomboid family serine protease
MSELTPPIRHENNREITDSNRRVPVADRRTARPFTLWREVLVAYLAPALMAGAGGVASGQSGLTMAAFTSIAGTSAVVALLIGSWLQHRGRSRTWTTALPRIMVAAILAVGAAVIAGLVGWLASRWLPDHTSVVDTAWLARLHIDLPISAAVAAVIVSWRWRRQNP